VVDASLLARAAVAALIEEARLTPKPALVDRRGRGAHRDLDLESMIRSAHALRAGFTAMAQSAIDRRPDQHLREELAAIGRDAELAMLDATDGSNAHRGAIWVLGLLIAGAAMSDNRRGVASIAGAAAAIAQHDDRFAPVRSSNGSRVIKRFGVAGARGEAMQGFPHVVRVGLPALRSARARGIDEDAARIDTLLSIMSGLNDTCLLHRGGFAALDAAKHGARRVLARGGSSTLDGRRALLELDADLLAKNASPGGSADMLAAVLFLDRIAVSTPRKLLFTLRPRGSRRGTSDVRVSC
jgi:triphosphoribosyl-dephospho-CoA synthase